MASKLLHMIPGVEPNELVYLENLTKELTEEKLQTFATFYNTERKNQTPSLSGL